MKLKDFLLKNKIEKKAFAQRLGVSRPTLDNYIAGKYIPHIAKLAIEFITAGEVKREDWDVN